jgi:uncharacterized protein
MNSIISRYQEQQVLQTVLTKPQAQFMAMYGRRRIGKTHLIRHFFKDKGIYFELTGLKNGNLKKQLKIFAEAFSKCFYDNIEIAVPRSWADAFRLLTTKIKVHNIKQPIILFLDELSWLATPRSELLETLDHYWNTEWKNIENLKLIVCGSAAAWMLENVIQDKGGLHNRLTSKMLLQPYTLKQTEEFLKAKKMKLSQKNILDIYMVTGGVPYYLEFLNKSLSVEQNIQQLCFTEDAPLKDEFPQIFRSLFDHAHDHVLLIKTIAAKRHGLTREEIIRTTKMSSGGNLNRKLNELEAAGFIRSYTPLENVKKDRIYRVIDEYSLFYLRWIEPHASSGYAFPQHHWHNIGNTSAWNSWAGYSFEGICMKHFHQIQSALHLDRVLAFPSSWRYLPTKGQSDEQGAQIDLLLDRNDDAITICEIKYSTTPYKLEKSAALNLINKVEKFKQITKTKKQIFVALVTTLSVKPSLWLEDTVHQVITLEDLFG